MSWFTSIFTGGKTAEKAIGMADKIVDGTLSGIDAMWFTDEEKDKALQKRIETWLKIQEVLISENTAQSITRRIIAVTLLVVFSVLLLGAAGLYPLDPAWSAFLLSLADKMWEVVLLVAFFYFGYYGVAAVVNKVKQ